MEDDSQKLELAEFDRDEDESDVIKSKNKKNSIVKKNTYQNIDNEEDDSVISDIDLENAESKIAINLRSKAKRIVIDGENPYFERKNG